MCLFVAGQMEVSANVSKRSGDPRAVDVFRAFLGSLTDKAGDRRGARHSGPRKSFLG